MDRLHLIPEKVIITVSSTCGRRKDFRTPVGSFQYEPISMRLYPIGVQRVVLSSSQAFFIASPEKALFDRLRRYKSAIESEEDLEDYLFANMRLDESGFFSFRIGILKELEKVSEGNLAEMLIGLRRKMGCV